MKQTNILRKLERELKETALVYGGRKNNIGCFVRRGQRSKKAKSWLIKTKEG